MRAELWLQVAAYLTWIVCGIPGIEAIVDGRLPTARAAVWGAAFIVFGAAFAACGGGWAARVPRSVKVALVGLQALAAAVVVLSTGSGQSAALFVIIAAELPFVFDGRTTFAWVGAQAIVVAALFWWMNGPMAALGAGGAFAGFQVFAVSTAWLTRSESIAREALARTNTELTATRELLAENSRVAERLRIARDLHDTLGHHLTALTIQLEVASRLTEGAAAMHVREAHAVAKLLLGDVRDVVGKLRDARRLDLAQALRALALGSPALQIHLDMPAYLEVEDSAQAHALLRCVQEIITNATRHASARNLWITIVQRPEGVDLHARDDGRGVAALQWGNGLRGMRERFEEHAGHVEAESAAGRGFEVRAFLPRPFDVAQGKLA
jgi:signal transduction histidine kinase